MNDPTGRQLDVGRALGGRGAAAGRAATDPVLDAVLGWVAAESRRCPGAAEPPVVLRARPVDVALVVLAAAPVAALSPESAAAPEARELRGAHPVFRGGCGRVRPSRSRAAAACPASSSTASSAADGRRPPTTRGSPR